MAIKMENIHEDPEGIEHYVAPIEEVRATAWQLGQLVARSSFEINQLVVVTRGGLTPTDCISRSLDIRDIQTFAAEVYQPNPNYGENDPRREVPRRRLKVFREPVLNNPSGKGALFVEDVLDTGRTLGYIRRKYPEATTLAVYTKKSHRESLKYVDFYGMYVGDIWIDFPWEVEAETRRSLIDQYGSTVL